VGHDWVMDSRSLNPPPAEHYRHIACCVEESEGSHAALAEATRLRALVPGNLSVLHVLAPASGIAAPEAPLPLVDGDADDAAHEWLTELVSGIPTAEPVLLRGSNPAATVCMWARQAGVDLLVAGASRGRLERILRGDFSGHLLSHAPCSVLFVKPRL
jgi:nucleotide-binding universal stress UspA family protein